MSLGAGGKCGRMGGEGSGDRYVNKSASKIKYISLNKENIEH